MKQIIDSFLSNTRIHAIASVLTVIVIVGGIGILVWRCSFIGEINNKPIGQTALLSSPTVTLPSTVQSTERTLPDAYPDGTIIFGSRVNETSPHYEYYLMNSDGTPLANIGEYTGFSAWSPDGKTLAIGCANPDQICILDMTSIAVYRSFPMYIPENFGKLIVQKLDLPAQCNEIKSPFWGINSLSWSRDGKQLIVVCTNNPSEPPRSEVCILSLSNTSDCWTPEKSTGVLKAVFSPTEDILAISKNGGVEIVDRDGNSYRVLVRGTNPAWSPDGEKLAYFAYFEDGPRNGIAIIDKEGKDSQWLYLQPEHGTFEEYLCAICEGANQGGISWSPDGEYVIFSADYLGDYTIGIFRLEVETKEIAFLVGLHGFFSYPVDPNWGRIEYR